MLAAVAADRAEITRTEKGRDIGGPFVWNCRRSPRTPVPRQRVHRHTTLTPVKQCRVKSNILRMPVHDFVEVHWLLKEKAKREEVHAERQIVLGPLRTLEVRADGLVVVVVQLGKRVREPAAWRWYGLPASARA